MTWTALYIRARKLFNLLVWLVFISLISILNRVVEIKETWLDQKWLKLIKSLFIINFRPSKRQKRASVSETEISLTIVVYCIFFGQFFFFFSGAIIILDDSFADHVAIIFWIILACCFFAIEGVLIFVLGLGSVWGIRMIVLVGVVIVFVKKPSHS